ncbi:uncharacterized protein LJ206_014861 isoform 1-T2 [Theristicus caerulescens]
MAAEAELGGVPPSRASAPPRGRGLSAALSGLRGRARAAGGAAAGGWRPAAVLWGAAGAGGDALLPWSSLAGGGGSGGGVRRRERQVTSDRRHPRWLLRVSPGEGSQGARGHPRPCPAVAATRALRGAEAAPPGPAGPLWAWRPAWPGASFRFRALCVMGAKALKAGSEFVVLLQASYRRDGRTAPFVLAKMGHARKL